MQKMTTYRLNLRRYRHSLLLRYMFLHELGQRQGVEGGGLVRRRAVKRREVSRYSLQSPHGHKKSGEALSLLSYQAQLSFSSQAQVLHVLSRLGTESGILKGNLHVKEVYTQGWNKLKA